MRISKKIKLLREQKKLSQAEFGAEFGVSYGAVSKWERDKNVPDPYMLIKIIKFFNISFDEFYEDITE